MPAVDDLPVSRKRSMVVGLVALGSSALAVYAVNTSHRCRQDLPPDQQPGCSSPSSSNGHGSSSTSSDYSSSTIGDEAAGIGVREDVSPITKNTSRFVPHAILP